METISQLSTYRGPGSSSLVRGREGLTSGGHFHRRVPCRACLQCKATRCQNWELTKPVSVAEVAAPVCAMSWYQLLASLACISQTNQNSSSSNHSAAHLIDTQTINTDSIQQPFIVGGILSSCNQSLLITGDEVLSSLHSPPATVFQEALMAPSRAVWPSVAQLPRPMVIGVNWPKLSGASIIAPPPPPPPRPANLFKLKGLSFMANFHFLSLLGTIAKIGPN